jgi:hypothetical protein
MFEIQSDQVFPGWSIHVSSDFDHHLHFCAPPDAKSLGLGVFETSLTTSNSLSRSTALSGGGREESPRIGRASDISSTSASEHWRKRPFLPKEDGDDRSPSSESNESLGNDVEK